jgi:hypothetical protein
MRLQNRDLPVHSSFLSCEKDAEAIIKKLFVTSGKNSEALKRLLVINSKDCLDNSNKSYEEIVKNTSVKELMEEKYITLVPRIQLKEHQEIRNHIILSFDNFYPTENPEFRDCIVHFDILCHTDLWDLGDCQVRPIKIMGYIDGILNESKLSGIGTLQFGGATELLLNDSLAGYTLSYLATHGSDDRIEGV